MAGEKMPLLRYALRLGGVALDAAAYREEGRLYAVCGENIEQLARMLPRAVVNGQINPALGRRVQGRVGRLFRRNLGGGFRGDFRRDRRGGRRGGCRRWGVRRDLYLDGDAFMRFAGAERRKAGKRQKERRKSFYHSFCFLYAHIANARCRAFLSLNGTPFIYVYNIIPFIPFFNAIRQYIYKRAQKSGSRRQRPPLRSVSSYFLSSAILARSFSIRSFAAASLPRSSSMTFSGALAMKP